MLRVGVELVAVGDLGDAAEIHHRDAVGDVAHHREIVGDEQVAELEPRLQVLEQIHDLPLDRDVERRHRLVADDEARLERKRARDADALALAARELVRIAIRHVGEQPDLLQQRFDTRALLLPALDQPVDVQRLADDLARPSCAD